MKMRIHLFKLHSLVLKDFLNFRTIKKPHYIFFLQNLVYLYFINYNNRQKQVL